MLPVMVPVRALVMLPAMAPKGSEQAGTSTDKGASAVSAGGGAARMLEPATLLPEGAPTEPAMEPPHVDTELPCGAGAAMLGVEGATLV